MKRSMKILCALFFISTTFIRPRLVNKPLLIKKEQRKEINHFKMKKMRTLEFEQQFVVGHSPVTSCKQVSMKVE